MTFVMPLTESATGADSALARFVARAAALSGRERGQQRNWTRFGGVRPRTIPGDANMLMPALRPRFVAGLLLPAALLLPTGLAAQNAVLASPHLAIGDRVVVKVWPEVKLSDTTVVDERGEISLPHVGSIGVLSFDYDRLRDTLRARYGTFLRNPVIDVIARAGGVAPNGDAHKVAILRGGQEIPATNWDKPAVAPALQLQSGDVILVGRRWWCVENLGTVTGVAGLVASLAFALFRK